ncbi:MAG TPA: hypothetical protein VGO89_12780 [Streptomyces sp.]|jgi:hypothetical protein|nr:hypothetical protein [Streptomyces sp.]
MSTILIIVLIVVIAAVVVAGAVYARSTGLGRSTGGSLRRRFGPEYERVVARHNGDTKAAERELALRVQQHGSLNPLPLPPQVREQYVTRWTAAQERFVDSPQHALAEAELLLGGLAQARGFPGPERHDEHVDALSVHHAHHIEGYRRVHLAATGQATTEEMREAMLQARVFFDALATEHSAAEGAGRNRRTGRPLTHDGPARRPLLSTRRHNMKGREAS